MAIPRISTPILVAAGLLAGGLVAAGSLTATGALADPSPSPSRPAGGPQYGERPGGPGKGGPFGGGLGRHGGFGPGFGPGAGQLGGDLLHGEFVVKTATGTKTELVQHGAVTANSGGTVTVKSSDGFTVAWTVDSSTKIRAGRSTEDVAKLAVGDQVTAVGAKSSSGATATAIAEQPAGGSRPKSGKAGATPSASAST